MDLGVPVRLEHLVELIVVLVEVGVVHVGDGVVLPPVAASAASRSPPRRGLRAAQWLICLLYTSDAAEDM
eukprot:10218809-Alexandrium_andersonii.AAC.1